jgi:hypothetical protein
MTHKGDENLKRGNMSPGGKFSGMKPGDKYETATGGHLIVPEGNAEELRKGKARLAADDQDVRERVGKNPDAALEDIHSLLVIVVRNLLRRAARERSKTPDREVMNVVREFRQTQEAVNEARTARGALAEIDDFFATLDTRFEEAEARLAAGVTPAAVPPA